MAYCTLTADSGYLRGVKIGTGEGFALSAAEKTKAENYGNTAIEGALGTVFTTAGTPAAYPPLIVEIAELLAAAQAYRYIHTLHVSQGGAEGEKTASDKLEDKARAMLADIKAGKVFVYDAAGVIVSGLGPASGPSAPSTNAETDENLVFDVRAKPYQYKRPHTAYDESSYS